MEISIVDSELYFYFQRSDSIVHHKTFARRSDEIKANLRFVSFLLHEGYLSSVKVWFERTIGFMLELENSRIARQLIADFFSIQERKTLCISISAKAKVKWLCLYIPGLYTLGREMKRRLVLIKESIG